MNASASAPGVNPFPGLRPFREDEEYLFFGREDQVDAMVDKLAETRFLAVVGTSGSGKSSLVNCGLRPALRHGLMAHAGTAWRMAQFRPGGDPIGAMAHALAEDGVLFRDFAAAGLPLAEIVETTLRMSKRGLVDIFEQAALPEGVNLLVVVDQFEELFRYRRTEVAGERGRGRGTSEDAAAFVNLLLEVKAQTALPISVVLTMRSDFLGDCTQFPGLAEAVNAGQYLVPRLTRSERRAAIAGPVGVGGAEIAPVLLTRLVNDVGDNPDQLSILQHALNRTWASWLHDAGGEGALDLEHYRAIGTMASALDRHAEKAFAELGDPRRQEVCERIFKALTDKATDPRGTRRPTPLGVLCALADATEAEVTEVIDVFRKPSRSFLMPPAGDELAAETVIDISHESLMRVWRRLDKWADREARSAGSYVRLAETAALHAAGKAGLWRDPDLQLALDWRDRSRPNETWAARYHPGFAEAMRFLTESRDAREAERAAAEERGRRQLEAQARRARLTLGAALVLGVLAVTSFLFYLRAEDSRQEAARATDAAQNVARAGVGSSLVGFDPLHAGLVLLEVHDPEEQPFVMKALHDVVSAPLTTVLTSDRGEAEIGQSFNRDGSLLATIGVLDEGERADVTIWNTGTGRPVSSRSLPSRPGTPVEFHPALNHWSVVDPEGALGIWSWDGESIEPVFRSDETVAAAAWFSDDGSRVLALSSDGVARVLDATSGDEVCRFEMKLDGYDIEEDVLSDRFPPLQFDGARIGLLDEGRSVRGWDAVKGESLEFVPPEEEEGESVEVLAFSLAAGKQLVLRRQSLQIADLASGRMIREVDSHVEFVRTARFGPDGRFVAVISEDRRNRDGWVYDVESPAEVSPSVELEHVPDRTEQIAFSRDGSRIFSFGNSDERSAVWYAETGRRLFEVEVALMAMSADGFRVATLGKSGSGKNITAQPTRVIELGMGAELTRRAGEDLDWCDQALSAVEAYDSEVVMRPDGEWTAEEVDESDFDSETEITLVRVLDPRGAVRKKLPGAERPQFSPDGRFLVTAVTLPTGAKRLQLLDEEFELVRTFPFASGFRFSPDGRHLATVTRQKESSTWRTVTVWETASGGVASTLTGHESELEEVLFSPDGRWVFTRTERETVRIWHLASGFPIATLPWETACRPLRGDDPAGTTALSPDGSALVVQMGDERRVWAVGGERLKGLIRSRTNRSLPPEFRHRTLGESREEAWENFARHETEHGRAIDPVRRAEWFREEDDVVASSPDRP